MSEPTSEESLVGQVLLGKLEVVRLLGEGGMGAVYEVVHRLTRHHRALKLLHADFAKDGDVVARFLREASVAGRLNSAFVVETFDAGQLEDGSPYVLMEMLEGEPLADLTDRGPVPPERAAQLVMQACEGLAAAHAEGIVHRDIKPDNLFVANDRDGEERVKLLDFGISKFIQTKDEDVRLTQTGRVLGTPLYMSPEQAGAAKDLDERTDIYSLGVILYELLSGRPPFQAETLPSLVIMIHTGDYPAIESVVPNLSSPLASVVRRAMHKDRDQRFQTVSELRDALRPFATGSAASKVAVDSMGATMDVVALPRTSSHSAAALEPSGDAGAQAVLERPVAAATEPDVAPPSGAGRRTGLWAVGAGATLLTLLLAFGLSRLLSPAEDPEPPEEDLASSPEPLGQAPLEALAPEPLPMGVDVTESTEVESGDLSGSPAGDPSRSPAGSPDPRDDAPVVASEDGQATEPSSEETPTEDAPEREEPSERRLRDVVNRQAMRLRERSMSGPMLDRQLNLRK